MKSSEEFHAALSQVQSYPHAENHNPDEWMRHVVDELEVLDYLDPHGTTIGQIINRLPEELRFKIERHIHDRNLRDKMARVEKRLEQSDPRGPGVWYQ